MDILNCSDENIKYRASNLTKLKTAELYINERIPRESPVHFKLKLNLAADALRSIKMCSAYGLKLCTLRKKKLFGIYELLRILLSPIAFVRILCVIDFRMCAYQSVCICYKNQYTAYQRFHCSIPQKSLRFFLSKKSYY